MTLGLLGGMFDLDNDGKMDDFETAAELAFISSLDDDESEDNQDDEDEGLY